MEQQRALVMMSAEIKAQWLSERVGFLTGSNMWKAMDYLKNGNPSSERSKYMREVLAERVTGLSVPHFVTDAMQHGLDCEDGAVDAFVERYPQYTPTLCGFHKHPTIEWFGSTPDRFLDGEVLLEAKAPTTTTHVEWVLAGVVPEKHKPQLIAQLLCTGRKRAVFISWDPRIRDERLRLFVRKYEPTVEEMQKVEAAAVKFLDELDSLFDQFVSS